MPQATPLELNRQKSVGHDTWPMIWVPETFIKMLQVYSLVTCKCSWKNVLKVSYQYLVGGFNPFEKYEPKWESSSNRGENKKYLKPPLEYAFQTSIHQLQQAQAKGGHPGMTASVGVSGPSQIFHNINQLLILKYWAVFVSFDLKMQRSAKVN